MGIGTLGRVTLTLALCMVLASCGARSPFGRVTVGDEAEETSNIPEPGANTPGGLGATGEGSTIWDLLRPGRGDQSVQVNRYLWTASLDVLNFLPIQSVDPFTGVIVTGFGTPPGGGRAYRATVHITDPALEARSLRVAIQTQSGPVAAGTARAVEDAILARARQLRIADNRF